MVSETSFIGAERTTTLSLIVRPSVRDSRGVGHRSFHADLAPEARYPSAGATAASFVGNQAASG
ncbi:MAG TPA: hypothetical protein VG674_18735 [Amycolatopsis sp.]|nr:hypothetical protein [Amycolatopsis sp.]